MELLENLSDDQTALLGCFVALFSAGILMSLSFYPGRWNRPRQAITHRPPQTGDEQSKRAA